MVRAEIFGFDPMLIWAAAILGIIILAIIVLSNEDPLMVLVIGALIVIATLVIGNLFEYSVYSFSDNMRYTLLFIHPPESTLTWWLLDTKELAPIRSFVSITKYIAIGVVLFLTIIKAYGAFRGGWKTLKPGQFKEK
ncbi:MAG: hypothetical protein ACTSRG_10575 [Candidatus Helarchaeota archaeon]